MNFSELTDLIKEHNGDDPKETILDLIELYKILLNKPYALDDIINEFAKDYSLCPMCGEQLKHKIYKDPREYLGRECEEKIYESYCENCNEYME